MKYFKNSAVSCFSRILACLALYGLGSVCQAVAANNPIINQYVGYWKFDEATGLTAADSSPASNRGTLQGGANWVLGQIGSAISFDGQTGYVRVGADLSQWLGASASLSVWIKTTQSGKGDFFQSPSITGVESAGDGNDVFWGWIDATGRIGMQAGNGTSAKSLNPINDARWHHIGLTRDASSGRVSVYVDGALNSTAISDTGLKSTKFYSLGRIETTSGTPVYFQGQLDEVRLYNFVLGDADMQALAGLSSPAGEPPAISLSPADQTVLLGQPATFRVVASGTAPLSERWQRNTLDISGATTDAYTIASSTLTDNGAQFRCIVANAYGSVTSAVATLSVSTTPTTPSGVSASAVSTTQIALTWNASTNSNLAAVSYRIYRNGSLIRLTAATSYSDSSLSAGTQYCYTIVAYDNSGNSSPASAPACVTTLSPMTVNAPSNLAASAIATDKITVSWQDNANNEAGFAIERYQASTGWIQIKIVGPDTTSFSDTGLAPATTYGYRVYAFNHPYYSPVSAAVSATTLSPALIVNAPSNLAANAIATNKITVSWQDNANNEAGFAIERYQASTGWIQIKIVGPDTTSFSDTGLAPATTYGYRVYAFNHPYYSPVSAAVSATTLSPALIVNAPSNLAASAIATNKITVSWQDNANNEAGFAIERYQASTGWIQIKIVGPDTTSFSDTGLAPATTYGYRVYAFNNPYYSPVSAAVSATTLPAAPPSAGLAADEFVGPFNSWADLRSDYGAVGNGVADDTAALQAALNDVGKPGHSSVLYIPAGLYRVTQTLNLQAREHVSILGEHPDVTRLKWDGAATGVLLHLDGVAFSRVDRITFDGTGKAGVLVDQSLTGYGQGQFFDSGNEYADDVFQDAVNGIRGGNYDLGAAETSVLRCHFLRHSGAGIILKNFNALDWFIWYCTFDDNYKGVSNNPHAGSFHVFGSLFRRSTNADIDIANTGLFSLRYNTSLGSKRFFNSAYSGGNGAELTIQGNTIADTTADDAINIGTMGPVLLVDNVIASRLLALGAAVKQNSYEAPDMVSVGNTFTVANPLSLLGSIGALRLINFNNLTALRSTLNIATPTLPDVLENYNRPVFDVPVGANAAAIQQAINQAAALNGQRPVVHLPEGTYNIMQTIVVPANADLQLVGDGGRSILQWGGPQGTTPLLRLAGPSRAILRDFTIMTYGKAAGIVVENADQPGSRIFAEQAFLTRGMTANLLVDQLERATVELHDLYQSQTSIAPAATGTGVKVVGGPSAASGNSQGGKVSVFAGATSNNYLSFDVINGGRLLINDLWYEGPDASTFAHIAGNSTFTLQGSRLAVPVNGYSIRIDDLNGKAAVLTSQPDAPIVISGNGNGTVWVAGNEGHGSSNYFSDNSSTTLGVYTDNRWYDPSYGSRSTANQGSADNNLITAMLAHMRSERPLAEPTVLPDGVTDMRLYRVFIDATTIGLRLLP